MTGNHNESDLAEVTSRQTAPVTFCRFALMKKISFVLGGCSALLALLGFRVRCACCSDYLSNGSTAASKPLHCFRHRGACRLQHDKQAWRGQSAAKGDIHQLVRDWSQATVSRAAGEAGEQVLLWTRTTFLAEDFHGKSEAHTESVVNMMRAFGSDGRSGPIMVLS